MAQAPPTHTHIPKCTHQCICRCTHAAHTHAHPHAHTHSHTPRRTHTRTHPLMYTYTHARTRAHTNTRIHKHMLCCGITRNLAQGKVYKATVLKILTTKTDSKSNKTRRSRKLGIMMTLVSWKTSKYQKSHILLVARNLTEGGS